MNDHPPTDDPGCFKYVGMFCVGVAFLGLLLWGFLGGVMIGG